MSGYELRNISRQELESNEKFKQRQIDKTPEPRNQNQQLPDVVLLTPARSGAYQSSNVEPIDTYKLVFIILLIHGIGTLMPWNMFINAEKYFKGYKLRPSITNDTQVTRDMSDAELDNLRKNFLSYLGLASQIPNVLFNGINLIANIGQGNLNLRVNLMLAIEAVIFILTIKLATVDSYTWPGTFFYITMVSVVVLNMASGIYQNCIFGIGAKFPGKYTNAILIGSNLSGTFTSVVNLIAIRLAPEPQVSAMYYFITALFVIVICLVSYNMLHLNRFFKYYDRSDTTANNQLEINTAEHFESNCRENNNTDIPEALRKTVDAMVPRPNQTTEEESNFVGELMKKWAVFKKCWPQCLNVFFTFYITLALFPSVIASIQQEQDYISSEYFVAFACFFLFNFFAMLGNLLSSWTTWPGKNHIWTVVAARVIFVPFFLFCNFNPTSRQWPVLFESDIIYMIANILLALSSGYLSSLCMMFASSEMSPDEAPKAGMLAAFFLVFGIFAGINSSFLLTWIVELG